ncbi:hypothetical protein FACS189468_6510 [Spirochaetia bacterium]|nr:hypothetical protein FACS189468_6510 [Spirochaetia bacterium]
MRGIAFIGGEGPGPAECRRLVEEGAVPISGDEGGGVLMAAADSGLMAAEAAGLRPDWIVGDMDSLDDPRRLEAYPPGRVLRYQRDKDYTDTELALRLLWEQGCTETWLIGGGGGRTDHLFALRSLFEREPCPVRWITAAEDIFCLREGAVLDVSLTREGPRPPPCFISVFPLGSGPWEAQSRGLRWPLSGLRWDRGFFGISNEAAGESLSIRSVRGKFLVLGLRHVKNEP